MTEKERDAAFMARALALAEKWRGRTAPNPIVGCVIVNARGEVIAEGAHKGPGHKHGEIAALAKLDYKAPGATLYVNLEPCTHEGRTPPCMPVVRDSGVARVVIGTEDPIPGHGGGIEALRRAGIAVSRAMVAECDAANRPFLTWAVHKRPAFTLKAAITLDGKIATVKGHSKWITGEAARADVHRMRDTHDAVLVGVGTVLADDPWLTARLPRARDPIRIVLDGKLRTPASAHLLPKRGGPRTIIATSADAPAAKEKVLVKAGAEVWRFATRRNGQVPLDKLARALGEENITSVLVEGGGEVHASFLSYELADELVLYVAPKVVGGPARSWVGGKGIAMLHSAHQLEFVGEPIQLGADLKLTAVRKNGV
ncbi:MAG TPA: bifunctional diaminohydroxyphosphoribosylaminopyrimidine deaminase/5-amino-6-(5-phosphoribosylamino)uracil reductase RibD [Kofleriaceae bacterium]|nr:bifunctional diaminohydroxyphosphoribosylaminopyrimidine deaminase/5-amino-6-(5-phosphoribosylamino)uracil reductase RibD [Kofleriaceae bacterium]